MMLSCSLVDVRRREGLNIRHIPLWRHRSWRMTNRLSVETEEGRSGRRLEELLTGAVWVVLKGESGWLHVSRSLLCWRDRSREERQEQGGETGAGRRS